MKLIPENGKTTDILCLYNCLYRLRLQYTLRLTIDSVGASMGLLP